MAAGPLPFPSTAHAARAEGENVMTRAAPASAVRWDAADYHQNASAQTGWGRDVHDRLGLRGDEVVIDLGCGDGRLTAELADRVPRGAVVGVDADPDMVAFARREHARENLAYVEGDVRSFAVARKADLVVSTACLHWVADHEAVLRRSRAHLAPGGRIFFQMGGQGNCAELFRAFGAAAASPRWAPFLAPLPNPWTFHGPDVYWGLLPRCGFRPVRTALVPKDMVHEAPAALAAYLRTTFMPLLVRVPEAEREALLAEVVAHHVARRPLDGAGRTHAAMVRLEVEAIAVRRGGDPT
jgi:trans-aconitate methyltransferase